MDVGLQETKHEKRNSCILCRDRAEGGAGGALAPPLFCKNKNKFNKSNGVKNSKKSLIRK